MASLYDRIAARPGGLADLASARLRYEALVLLQEAVESAGLTDEQLAARAGMRVRAIRKALYGDGDVKVGFLAELLYAAGYEAEVRLVPASEPRG